MTPLPILGIDLGTTYSCVAQLDDLKPVAIMNGDGDYTTPSVVYFEDDGNVVVGKHAKNELGRDPDSVIQHIKREMGKDDFYIDVNGRDYYPPQISSMILESLVTESLDSLGLDVPDEGILADVVITVPAYFGGAERSATKVAGELARLNVLSIINEPTAAAVAHGLTGGTDKKTVLVYDLGGGTFDVTVVEASSEQIRAIATGGDRELGGADWDRKLKSWVLDKFVEEHPESDPHSDAEALGELDIKVEDAKQALTRSQKYNVNFTANTDRGSYEITRDAFEELTSDLVERTLHFTELVLDAAKDKGVNQLDEVIMVGGMSRMPVLARKLQERLAQRYGTTPVPRVTDPDQIVAKGAALFAANAVAATIDFDPNATEEEKRQARAKGGYLPGAAEAPAVPKVVNITSRGYGVKVVKDENDSVGFISWLIVPNDELPAAPEEEYFTVSTNQTEVKLAIYESATNMLNDDISVNTFLIDGVLKGLPPGQPPRQPIQVMFRLGDEGILEIIATAKSGERLKFEFTLPGQIPDEELRKPMPDIMRR